MKNIQENQPTPAETPAGSSADLKEEACPSVLDKPDHSAWEKPQKQKKKMSRQTRNIVIAAVLVVTLLLGSSGVCRLLYQKGLIAYISDRFSDTDSETTSAVSSAEAEEKLVFDYSYYGSADADTEKMALGGVKKITVKNSEDTLTLGSYWTTETQTNPETMKEEKQDVLYWNITDVKGKQVSDVLFSHTLVGFIVSDLLKIPYDSVYAEKADEIIPQGGMTYLEECGLNKPAQTCTVTFGNGAALTVLVGNATPTGDGVFLMVKANDGGHASAAGAPKADTRIYHVKADAVTYFTKGAQYFVDKDILQAVPEDPATVTEDMDEIEDPYFIEGELSYFDALSITGSAYPRPFVFTTTEKDYPGRDSIYLMTSPLTQNVDLTAMQQLLKPVAEGLSASDCLAMLPTADQLKKYGLQNPACRVNYTVKDVNYTLKVGNKLGAKGGEYAVMVEGNPSVFSVAASDLPFVGRTEADFASATVYSCDITKVHTLTVRLGGKVSTFTLKHGTDADGNATLKVTDQKGKAVDEEGFRNMYVDLLSLSSFTNVLDGKDAANPYMTVSLTYNGYNHTDTLRLSPYTDRRYFLSLNGMGSTVVLSSAVEELEQSYLALVQ